MQIQRVEQFHEICSRNNLKISRANTRAQDGIIEMSIECLITIGELWFS